MASKNVEKQASGNGRSKEPRWRQEAVEDLFEFYWDKSDPDPDRYHGETNAEERKQSVWQAVFVPLGEIGIWEILFPNRAECTLEYLLEVGQRFVVSGIDGQIRRRQVEQAIHTAAVLRVSSERRA